MPILATGRALIDPHKLLALFRPQGKRVVDMGCGGLGHFCIPAAGMVGDGEVIGVDINRTALKALRSRLKEIAAEQVKLLWADAEKPRGVPLENDSAHLVLLANLLPHTKSPLGVLQEAARLLHPQGEMVIVMPERQSPWYGLARTKEISEDAIRQLAAGLGLAVTRKIKAGPHHLALVLQKAQISM